jgi:methyltransferase-like protein/SAM-dependent methyltransferase
MTGEAAPFSYDEVPYPSFPVPQAHPDPLATLATLFGLRPAPVERCRVLELGCADGGHLIAMADRLPGSEFVGIDLSPRQIDTGRATVAALGLKNITLRPLSVLDVPDDLGPFDYITAHGIYSWVPPAVQDRMLAICGRQLAAHGVAYISYNALPGWHARGTVRELMRYHRRQVRDPKAATAAARDLLAFLLEAVPEEEAAYRGFLEEEQELLARVHDTYIYHEHLEDANEPVYFTEFVARAARHGLQFLAEADLGAALASRLSPQVAGALVRLSDDALTREQYLDFLTNRTFRTTLLCRADAAVLRDPQPDAVAGLYVAAHLEEHVPASAVLPSALPHEFRGPKGVPFTTGHAITKAALAHLADAWPRALPFAETQAAARARLVGDAVVTQGAAEHARDTRQLAENLLQGFAAGVVELHAHAPPLAAEPGERPLAPAFVRQQARDGTWVTNAWHQFVNLDPLTCLLLHHLDGSRDRAALVEVLAAAVAEGKIHLERYHRPVTDPDRVRGILRRELDANLRRLGSNALLTA